MRGAIALQPPQEMLENVRSASNAQPAVAAQAKLLLRLGQKRPKHGVAEETRGNDEATTFRPDVHGQAPRRHVLPRGRRVRILLGGVVSDGAVVVVVQVRAHLAGVVAGVVAVLGEFGAARGRHELVPRLVEQLLQELVQFLRGGRHHLGRLGSSVCLLQIIDLQNGDLYISIV